MPGQHLDLSSSILVSNNTGSCEGYEFEITGCKCSCGSVGVLYVLKNAGYQDTNNLNEAITSLLIQNGNFFAVGDDWQAIYSFRMSSVDHFINFKSNYPNGKIFRLEENYRSSDMIVQIGNELIKHNKSRVEKRCFSNKSGGVVELKIFRNDADEAEWVVQQIKTLNTSGVKFKDMAVLYRINKCSLKFEQFFRLNNIPYKILGGKGFFERKEVIDLLSYLSASVYDERTNG